MAWADQQLKPEENEILQSIARRLELDTSHATARISAYGAAIHHLAQKKGAKVTTSDPGWCSVLGITDCDILKVALSRCPQLSESPTGFTLKAGSDEIGKRQLIQTRNEATLLRLLLGNGAPLTSRFLSFRINPPKPFPELELIRLAESSPALVRYGIGNGKWLGARA